MSRSRYTVKVLDLPLHIRVKIALRHRIDVTGCWLAEHVSPEAAMWWWKAWRQW